MFKTFDKSIIKNQRYLSLLTDFFYGKYYPVYVALFALLFYTIKVPILGLTFFIILACATLLLFRDLTPFMPLPMMIMMTFSDLTFFSNPFAIVLIVLCAACLVSHLVLYPIKKFYFGKLFLPICLISVALFLGGIFSPYINDYARGLASSMTVGPLILVVYILFSNYSCPPQNFNYKEYFLYLLVIAGSLISAELLVHEYYTLQNSSIKFEMGYGNTNIVAAALLITIPASWYFVCVKRNMLLPFVALIFMYLGVFLSHSDGSLGVAGACIPVLAIVGYLNIDDYHKRIFKNVAILLCLILVFAIFVMSFIINLPEILLSFIDKVSNDNHRTPLYLLALKMFAKYPIFGVGLGFWQPKLNNNGNMDNVVALLFSFHSTFFHVIATMGLVGVITYAFYYVKRYKIILEKNTIFNIAAYMSFSMLQVYGIIDGCEFHALPILLFSTLLLLTTEKSNKEKDNEPLPLTKKDFKYKAF